MTSLDQLEQELKAIKERNKKVEGEKAWEISWTRKIVIAVLTYFVVSLFFKFAGFPNPWINSIVPTLGFILSTMSLSFLKNFWLKYIHKS